MYRCLNSSYIYCKVFFDKCAIQHFLHLLTCFNRGSHTSSKKQNSLKLEKSVNENRSQSWAIPHKGGVTTRFFVCNNSQRNCYVQSFASHAQASASQTLPSTLQNSSRNWCQVPFLHFHRRRNGSFNSLRSHAACAANYKSRNATWTISRNCEYIEDGVTTPNVDNP